MHISFVTHGDIQTLATVKRATGMASPLIKAGHHVSLIIQDTANNRERISFECPTVDPLFFKEGSARNQMSQKRQLIRQSKPDVVWVCAIGVRNWVCHILPRQKPVMLIEHSELRSGIQDCKGLRRWQELLLEYSTLFLFHGQVCASKYLETLFIQRAKKMRRSPPILYSPYAHNSDVMMQAPTCLTALKEQYAGKKVLLYMGTLTANYGLFDMLSAVDRLRLSRKDFVLLVMGGGRHKNDAVDFIARKGLGNVVQLLGHVPEQLLSSYFRLADAFLCPLQDTIQDWARCPSKLFMFLPFQKPIVTCRIGEAAQLLGDDAFYFEPGDVPGLEAALERALYSTTGWSPAWQADDHSWEARSRQLLEWLNLHWKL